MNKMVLPCRGNIIMKKSDKNQPISPTLKIKLFFTQNFRCIRCKQSEKGGVAIVGSACTIKCIYTRHLYVIRRREIYYILLFLSLVGIFEMPQYDGKKFLNGCYTSRAPLTTEVLHYMPAPIVKYKIVVFYNIPV